MCKWQDVEIRLCFYLKLGIVASANEYISHLQHNPEIYKVFIRIFHCLQMISCLGICAAFLNRAKDVNLEQPIYTNAIQRFDQNNTDENSKKDNEVKALKKVFLSSRSITCNDGSQAG